MITAGLVLHAPASAEAGKETLTLKAVVQVATDEVMLRDLVNSNVVVPEGIVICRTPDAGAVRTVSLAEISATLKRHDIAYTLRGPEQISVVRMARKLLAADLTPLIENALHAQNVSAEVNEVQLQAAIFVKDINGIQLRKLKFDPAINKYRAWFAMADAPHAGTFEALVALDHGVAPIEIQLLKTGALSSQPTAQVKRGETAAMLVDGAGFSATLSVICLENGPAEKTIRVREQASKRIYRAQVIGPGQLHAVSREN